MSSTQTASCFPAEDPDAGWKPKNRPQSTVALNFMSELDDLFRVNGGIDVLDKNVHQKKQSVSIRTQELEALQAKLRETEERLSRARNSPPRRKDSQRRTPIEGEFPAQDRTAIDPSTSPTRVRHDKERMAPGQRQHISSDRPLASRNDEEEDEEEEEDDDDDEDDDEDA